MMAQNKHLESIMIMRAEHCVAFTAAAGQSRVQLITHVWKDPGHLKPGEPRKRLSRPPLGQFVGVTCSVSAQVKDKDMGEWEGNKRVVKLMKQLIITFLTLEPLITITDLRWIV